MSLFTGNYLDKFKLVKVIPIHKGGSTQDLNNFRPRSDNMSFLMENLPKLNI